MSRFDTREAPPNRDREALTSSHREVQAKSKSSGQTARVLSMLHTEPAVCSTTFLAEYIPRAAAVIHRLQKQGYLIVTRECSRGHSHDTYQVEYVLIRTLGAAAGHPFGGAE